MELCRRAVYHLEVDRHSSPPQQSSSRFGGRYFPSVPAAVKHCLPLFKDFADELKDPPHSARLMLQGYGEFINVKGMEEASFICTPPMDIKLASYLGPEAS